MILGGYTYDELLDKLQSDLNEIANSSTTEVVVTSIRDEYVDEYVYDNYPGVYTEYEYHYGGRRGNLSRSGSEKFNQINPTGNLGEYQFINTVEPNKSIVTSQIPKGANLMQWLNDGLVPNIMNSPTYPWHREGFLEATVMEINKKKLICKATKTGLSNKGYRKDKIKIK